MIKKWLQGIFDEKEPVEAGEWRTDNSLPNVETFISLQAGGYILTKGETADTIERAERSLINKMMEFDYENQLTRV